MVFPSEETGMKQITMIEETPKEQHKPNMETKTGT